MVIGIVGGIGSGKSTILDYIDSICDCIIVKTDDLAKSLEQPNSTVYNEIIKHFDKTILNEDKTINSKILANIVFNDSTKLETLNKIIHPKVIEEIKTIINNNKNKLIFIESAILFESKLNEICDEIWCIYADEELRRERLKTNRNYNDKKIDEILNIQMDENELVLNSDVLINNNDLIKMQKKVSNKIEMILKGSD